MQQIQVNFFKFLQLIGWAKIKDLKGKTIRPGTNLIVLQTGNLTQQKQQLNAANVGKLPQISRAYWLGKNK